MKQPFYLSLLFILSIFAPQIAMAQECDANPDLTPWLDDDPNFEGVGIYLKIDTNYVYQGTAFSNELTIVDVDLSEVSKVVFTTNCRSSEIMDFGGPESVGSICSDTFECPDDFHFYSAPSVFDPYFYPHIRLQFDHIFNAAPSVDVYLNFTECGLTAPILTYPHNDASNTGTNFYFEWEDVPAAVDYTLNVKENCLGCPVLSYQTGASQYLINLGSGNEYLWSVRANNPECPSAWASAYFWTGNAPPGVTNMHTFFSEGAYETANEILCDIVVENGENVVLRSSTSITLNPGFQVNEGGKFAVLIE